MFKKTWNYANTALKYCTTCDFTAPMRDIFRKASLDCNLCSNDIVAVQCSWKTLIQECEKIGFDIYKTLFYVYPQYESFFSKYKCPGCCIFDIPEFIDQARKLVNSMDSIINKFADEHAVVPELVHVGNIHRPLGVTSKHFKEFADITIITLRRNLGNNFTPELECSWNKVMRTAMTVTGAVVDSYV